MSGDAVKTDDWQEHAQHALELLRKAKMIHDLERKDIMVAAEALTITGALVNEAVEEMERLVAK